MTSPSSLRVRADVFPAHVTLTQGDDVQVMEKVRLIVTQDTVFIYKDSSTGPTLAYQERLQSYDPGVPVHRRTRSNPMRLASVTTDSGTNISFGRMGSCGCGSRLKAFDPFAQITSAASTKDR